MRFWGSLVYRQKCSSRLITNLPLNVWGLYGKCMDDVHVLSRNVQEHVQRLRRVRKVLHDYCLFKEAQIVPFLHLLGP